MDKKTSTPAPGTTSKAVAAAKTATSAASPGVKPLLKPRTAAPRAAQPRRASAGDIAPAHTPEAMEAYDVAEAASAAVEQKTVALKDIIAHATPGDAVALAKSLEAIMTGASPDDAAALRLSLIHIWL